MRLPSSSVAAAAAQSGDSGPDSGVQSLDTVWTRVQSPAAKASGRSSYFPRIRWWGGMIERIGLQRLFPSLKESIIPC